MRPIDLIVVHCSDSDVQAHDNIETIRTWHVKENGWSDIGYNFFIPKDGNVHIGRDEEFAGAHVRGFNRRSIGVCLSGKKLFTDAQFHSLGELCKGLMIKYGISKDRVVGHCDLDPLKTCPNFDLKKLVDSW